MNTLSIVGWSLVGILISIGMYCTYRNTYYPVITIPVENYKAFYQRYIQDGYDHFPDYRLRWSVVSKTKEGQDVITLYLKLIDWENI